MSEDRELQIGKDATGKHRTHWASIGDVFASIDHDGTVYFDLDGNESHLYLHGSIGKEVVKPRAIRHLTPEASDDVWALAEALRKAQDADPEGQKAKRIEALRKELATLTGADQ
jgi:hypothetical protein